MHSLVPRLSLHTNAYVTQKTDSENHTGEILAGIPEEGLDLSVVKQVNGNLDDDADKGEHKEEK